mmetsp:Transcript_4902/g.6657  ORF Transcript_4902/g.6657 Transcript_4902/m.6657 type:complete len:188 (+) Transcript_4902:223-786(+)
MFSGRHRRERYRRKRENILENTFSEKDATVKEIRARVAYGSESATHPISPTFVKQFSGAILAEKEETDEDIIRLEKELDRLRQLKQFQKSESFTPENNIERDELPGLFIEASQPSYHFHSMASSRSTRSAAQLDIVEGVPMSPASRKFIPVESTPLTPHFRGLGPEYPSFARHADDTRIQIDRPGMD